MSESSNLPPDFNTRNIFEHSPLVRAEVYHPIADGYVCSAILDRKLFGVSHPELHIVETRQPSVVISLFEHLRGHVHTDDRAGLTDRLGGDDAVETRAASNIYYSVPRLDDAYGERVANTGERLNNLLGKPVNDITLVTERIRERSPCVEVKCLRGVRCHLGVLFLYLVAQDVNVDGTLCSQSRSPMC